MPCPGPRVRGGTAPPLGGEAAGLGVGGGEGGGSRAGAGAGGSTAPRPRPAPPRRHFAGGCRGDRRRRRRRLALRRRGAAAGRETSELQPGESRAAAPPARPASRTCRAGPRGARRTHEAGLARPPRAVTGPRRGLRPPSSGRFPGSPHPRARVAAGPVDAPQAPSLHRPTGPGLAPGRSPWPPRETQRARALRPRRGEASGSPRDRAGRPPMPPPGPSAHASWGRSLLVPPREVRAGIPAPPGIQGHQEGGGGVVCLVHFLLSSLLQRLRQVILEAAAPTPGPFSQACSPGGREFPLLLPCWKEKLTFLSVITLRAQNFLLPLTLDVPLSG